MFLGFTLAPAAGFKDAAAGQKRGGGGFRFRLVLGSHDLVVEWRQSGIGHEATLLASALATQTSRIGLLVTAAPARHEPYNLARRLASLDWISKGRVGWVIDAGGNAEREDEYVRLVGDLWNSWDDDAFIYDKAAGRLFTPEKMRVLNHAGPNFSVRGPLNVNRSPQGKPPIAALAATPLAQAAEVVLLPEGSAGSDQHEGQADGTRALAGWSDFSGAPGALADRLERASAGLDGFVLAPSSAAELQDFIHGVVPELARRGLIGRAPAAGTLRDRLGLPRPAFPAKLEASA